jgi:hypothetical protein
MHTERMDEDRMENIPEGRWISGKLRAPEKVILKPIQFFSFLTNEEKKVRIKRNL